MRCTSVVSVVLSVLIGVLLSVSPSSAQWDMAELEPISSGPDFDMLGRRALAIDDLGCAHAIYRRGVGAEQTLNYHAKPAGGTWSAAEVIGAPGTYAGTGWIDIRKATGEPYVVFYQNEVLTLGIRRSGGWEFHSLNTPAEFGISKPALTVDSAGLAHISMLVRRTDPLIWQIAYGYWDGSSDFHFQIVPGSFVDHQGLFAQPDIVVRRDGSIVTSYQHLNASGQILVRVSENDSLGGTFWNHEEVDVPGVILFPESLEIGDHGAIHLGFHTNIELGADHHVYYAARKGKSFGTPVEVSGAYTGARPRIALTRNGKPHMVFEETLGPRATGRLVHAYKTQGDWQQIVVQDDEAYTPTFLMDAAGNGSLLFERKIVHAEDNDVHYYGYVEPK